MSIVIPSYYQIILSLGKKLKKNSREKLWRREQASEVTLDNIFECLVEDFGLKHLNKINFLLRISVTLTS